MKVCSKCKVNEPRKGQRYCLDCHNAYLREWRKTHTLNDEQRKKANARSYAKVYYKRGKIIKTPCIDCGSLETEKHHEDYDKPIDVIWLCRNCHSLRHKGDSMF